MPGLLDANLCKNKQTTTLPCFFTYFDLQYNGIYSDHCYLDNLEIPLGPP